MVGETAIPSEPTDESSFDALLARCLERFEAEGHPGVEAFCAEHPDTAARLRHQVGQLLQMGLLEAPGRAAPDFPERLGPFRLQTQLGGGGMGVVFLAEQEDLGREVALKLIRPDQLYFPGMRERFRREVETIARLDHPGIVPVYTVGEQDGLPYFAMQRVRGSSLADVLQRLRVLDPSRLRGRDIGDALADLLALPGEGREEVERVFTGSYEEQCLRLARQVAEALHHAHEHGVLHRDVKPSNVMITPDGRAQLLDFGLAASAGADALTRSGTPLGSLYYMSPEQGRGAVREVDRRSDVYGLGVTLYEMLALAPPFTGDSAHEILSRIDEGSTSGLRECNSSVTWECETVVQKAMDRDPQRRYATAAAFARDLENVLEHRPVAARRAGPILRLRRFGRRRPALAVLLAIGVPAVTLGPLLLYAQERAARRAIDEKRAAADRNFGRALDAVDAMLSDVSEVDLRHVPQMEGVRRALIEKALAFYQEFLAEPAVDDDVRRRAATVLVRCGTLHDLLGDYDRAGDSYREALSLVTALRRPEDAEFAAVQTAVCRRSLAAIDRSLGKVDDALTAVRASVDALDAYRARGPVTTALESERAECLITIGTLLLERDLEGSERAFREAIPLLETLSAAEPWVVVHRRRLARVNKNLGVARDWRGDLSGAAELYRAGLAYFEALLAGDPGNTDYRYDLSSGLMNLGSVLYDDGHDGEAELRRCIDLLDGLCRDFPTVLDYRMDAVKAQYNLAFYLARTDERDDEVRAIQARMLDDARALVREQPEAREHIADLARGLDGVCMFERKRGRLDEALAAGEEAAELRREEVRRFDDSPDAHRNLGAILHNVALVRKERREFTAAISLLDEAIREQERSLEQLPGHANSVRFLRFHRDSLAECRLLDGDLEGALAATEVLRDASPERGPALRAAASLHARIAAALTELDPPDAARAAALGEQAISELREALAAGYADLDDLLHDEDHERLRALPGFDAAIAPLVAAKAGNADGPP